MCYNNGTEQPIGGSWIYSWELMKHLLSGCSNILWCGFSAVWWCSELNILHHSDYICPRFTKIFVLFIRSHPHWYKLSIIVSMVIAISQYQPLTKAIFSSPKTCRNILNIFWGRINTTNIPVSNKLWYLKLPCIVRDCIVWSTINCIGASVSQTTRLIECSVVRLWGSGICHYHCIFETHESVHCSFIISNLQNFTGINPYGNFLKDDVCDHFCFSWLNPIFWITSV